VEAKDFKSLKISLASPEQIESWSYGEVTRPETINYRRLRPEKDGLFCEAIFGPTKDWQCYCGKYKNVRYRGIVCDKCGVEITRSSVRRERMGHIRLAAPVAHVWYTRRVPSYLGVLLDISRRNLDRVLYFAQYVVTNVDEEARQRALKRLEEELAERRAELEASAQESIGAIEEKRDNEIAKLEQQLAEIDARFEEKLNTVTDPIMQAAQKTEAKIEELQGQVTPAALAFEPSGKVVVEAGTAVGREHLGLLQEAVRESIEDAEADVRGEQERARRDVEQLIEDWRAGAATEIERIEAKLAQDVELLDRRLAQDRDEILSLAEMQFLNEPRYRELRSRWGQIFRAGMGAEAFFDILADMDLDKLAEELWNEVRTTRSKQRRKKATRRLRVVEWLRKSGNRPEWLILTILPVIPPDLRPMVQLDGGRFATSDLNDLYRRVINRNNRLKRLLELGAPDVIVRNEKRMLQEAVDSLIDNSQRGKALSRRGRRELKSLSDMLKGKKGRFRRNLLGKRVDYSGRSVIVIGPNLKLHQCGLPKTMALELYRPFVISKLVDYNFASNVKGAKRIIERERPEVWEVLEEVIQDRPVLLNRAPTLHRLGIQAFEPVLVEGKAIQIHPLVCAAFNADFDGDQMAVHVPLSRRAVAEARKLMLATKNLLKPADGTPIVGPSKDMVLGVYYLTMTEPVKEDAKPAKVYADMDEVSMAYELGLIRVHDPIRVRTIDHYSSESGVISEGEPELRIIDTTVGRVLFNQVVPETLRFVNEVLEKGGIQRLVALCYQKLGPDATTDFVDAIKDIGFKFATRSGTTIAVSDLTIPDEKYKILDDTSAKVSEVERQYRRGLLTEAEQYTKTIELWTRARDQVADAVAAALDPTESISLMAESGATKGGFLPVSQMAGMKGMVADPAGRIIDHPILANFREGLTALEYFISTHGARKGLADTALRTADAGYLTRRLVDVAQDVIINAQDCGTDAGTWLRVQDNVGRQTLSERIVGRVAAAPVAHPETGELIVEKNQMILEDQADLIERLGFEEVFVRSPLTCELPLGICAQCYGRDLGRGLEVSIGSAVGIVAAQSIGEPGTQLTLRTFHTGGVAAGADITHGLPRVEELFEARKRPKGEAIISDIGGVVHVERVEGVRVVRVEDSELMEDTYEIDPKLDVKVEDGDEVNAGDVLAAGDEGEIVAKTAGRVRYEEYNLRILARVRTKEGYNVPGNWGIKVEEGQKVESGDLLAKRGDQEIVAGTHGRVELGRKIYVIWERKDEREYEIPSAARILVEEAEKIEPGHQLTEGSKNPHRILAILGREATQHYLLQEVQRVYRSQGVNINEKHFEVILRKMLSKVMVTASGDSDYLVGELVDRLALSVLNEQLMAEGREPARGRPVLLGITKAALETESFLSASSFQHTIKVLAGAALEGKRDDLTGLKENVIIGKLIPAGTGFRGDLEVSDGPIESYEGVVLRLPEPEEAEEVEAPEEAAEPEAAAVEDTAAAAAMTAAAPAPGE
jgi:DNA-directed RNA polymerase subunit beta'